MPLERVMLAQRAVRKLLPDPVDDAIVLRCIELALQAPTGSNGQNWEFVVVRDRAAKQRLGVQYQRAWSLYGRAARRLSGPGGNESMAKVLRAVEWQVEHFADVPVVVVACLRGGRPPLVPLPAIGDSSYYGSIYPAVQNLLLAARAMGLGASLVTLPLWSTTVVRRILGLPLSVQPCCSRCRWAGPSVAMAQPLASRSATSSISTATATGRGGPLRPEDNGWDAADRFLARWGEDAWTAYLTRCRGVIPL